MKKVSFIVFILLHVQIVGQVNNSMHSYPKGYFQSPMDIPLILSGTFAELRGNHFHAGLDIKTNQREGLHVFAAAEGYVSRIKISHWGYGKAIYITHPNGYTTVYAHLQKFNGKIQQYIKKQQYKKESFEIQVFPEAGVLPVKKGELIAFSGSTGGFVGPHLHFEIRNTKSEKPINPFYFGFEVPDSKIPRINALMAYPLGKNAQINRLGIPTKLNFVRMEDGNLLANKINAHGLIGFGVNAFDQLDGAFNKNGLYALEMYVNGNKRHRFEANSFSFAESKLINLLIDYERYETLNQRIQKCFIEPENKLSVYEQVTSKGYINIEDMKSYNIEIHAVDFAGNRQIVKIPVIGKKDSIIKRRKKETTPFPILAKQFHKYAMDYVTVAFPKNSFYYDQSLDFSVKDSIVTVHKKIVPLNKNYTLTFNIENLSDNQKSHVYIAGINDNGSTSYLNTKKKDNTCYTSTKRLGKFTLKYDYNAPLIKLHNFKKEQWVTNYNELQVKISDVESGIQSYRGEIDGSWILMEYNVKKGTLTYDLNDKSFDSAKHELKVVVIDNVGNTEVLTASFYRKK